VQLLKNMLDEEEQAKIALMLADELIKQHFSFSLWIRNNLKFY